MSENLAQAKSLLKTIKGTLSQEERIEKSIQLAALIQKEANLIETPLERKYANEMSRMMHDPKGKAFIVEMMDQAFRSSSNSRTANQINYLISQFGIPSFLKGYEKWGMKFLKIFGKLAIPFLKSQIRKKTNQVILPAEEKELKKAIQKLRKEGVKVNLNHLGEAILGEEEAKRRLDIYLNDLDQEEVDYVSVKISTLYSQINLLSSEKSLSCLSIPYKKLLLKGKFINLDMEEYKDLALTVALFKQVLLEKEFIHIPAGIVLQSYLPDSYHILSELIQFAKDRAALGGAFIKIRIVKGANLAMEKVESEHKGWPQAPYEHKAETDANFIKMVDLALDPDSCSYIKVGVGSHNLFDIAYALILSAENGVEKSVAIEMLKGMSEPSRRVIQSLAHEMLLYCPAAHQEEFQNAIAYLVRRLDENTGEENFLRVHFGLQPGTSTWQHQADRFASSVIASRNVSSTRRRTQNRNKESYVGNPHSQFQNEPDTDWSLPENVAWAKEILNKRNDASLCALSDLCGKKINHRDHREHRGGQNGEAIKQEVLYKIAELLREGRGNLIHAMAENVGKSVYESDVEVSEAIDFAVYYAKNIATWKALDHLHFKPKGTILIASSWNFPCSIPAGGILAALATGNKVIFKPAPEAVIVGQVLVDLFWKAGVSKDVLQFVPCDDDQASLLVKDPAITAVVLTGSTETAKKLLKMRPGLDLMAETGGKNAIIVTNMADLDLAIKDIVQSAFGFSGQKCSACSLVILEAEVYDNPHFKRQLKSAVESLIVGEPWDTASKITPLIKPPEGPLKKAIEEEGEWLLKPKSNGKLVSPGIKWNVAPGSFIHQTELFGPIIGVMRAKNLKEAIQFANGTQYGLTSGIHSLDVREHAFWLQHIHAGNCYINRGITGAIVERQPFGGTKASSFGKGAKAGGPNYLLQFMKIEEKAPPSEKAAPPAHVHSLLETLKLRLNNEDMEILEDSAYCYSYFWKHFFSKSHDPMKLLGQDNLQVYLPKEHVVLRICPGDSLVDIFRVAIACAICNTPFSISIDPSRKEELPFKLFVETDLEFANRIDKIPFPKVRLLQKPSQELIESLSNLGVWTLPEPVLSFGRIELLHYLREVSISRDYHRYGNVGETL